jgi:4-hydroxybenzoate polyprenyltransferase
MGKSLFARRQAFALAERVAATARAGEWWDDKLVPILCGYYASACFLGVTIFGQWQSVALLFASLIPGAVYVSALNDVTDLEADAAAGKANRMAGRGQGFRAAVLGASIAAGLPFFWVWRHDPLLLLLYAAAWISFTLYSAPPFRLKARGLAGLVADAAGAHLFPTLLATALAFSAAGRMPDPLWFGAVAAWALGYGLRGNLWHQLLDRERDRAIGLTTFAATRTPGAAARLADRFAFPLEAAGLFLLLGQMRDVLPVLFLAAYALLVYRRVSLWHMHAVLAVPRPPYLILLHEYYGVFLPLALLAGSASRHPWDAALLAAHLILFRRRVRETWRVGWSLVLRPLLQRLRLVTPPTANRG